MLLREENPRGVREGGRHGRQHSDTGAEQRPWIHAPERRQVTASDWEFPQRSVFMSHDCSESDTGIETDVSSQEVYKEVKNKKKKKMS